MSLPYHMSILVLLITLYANLVLSLYEDQIGKFDWKINQLGRLSFSNIEHKTKVYVATEENVIAGLSTKTGQILWRQILEKGDNGKIQLMRVTDKTMVTVSGSNPFTVRGWNIDRGSLVYEWNIPASRWPEVLWSLHQGQLFMVSIGKQEAEVSVYNVRTGGQPSVHMLKLPNLPEGHNVVMAGLYVVYSDETGEQIVSVSVTGKHEPSMQHLTVPSPLTAVVSTGKEQYVQAGTHLYALKPDSITLINTQVPTGSGIAVLSHSGQNKIIVVEHANKELHLSGRVLETGSVIPEISAQIVHEFPLSSYEVNSAVCVTRRDMSIACQLLLSGKDHSILLVKGPGGLQWVREEALTSIANMELLDLPVSDGEVAIEKEFNNKEGGAVGMFVRRVGSQLLQLQTLMLTVLGLRVPQAGGVDLVRDDFGLHRMIVAVTSVGKVFGIDNLNHKIVWQFTLDDVVPLNNTLFVQRTARHHPYPAQCVVLFRHQTTKETVLYAFNPITGKPTDGEPLKLSYQVLQVMQLAIADDHYFKGLLLLEPTGKVHVYPESSREIALQLASKTYMYTAETATGQLTGYSLTPTTDKELIALPLWEVKLFARITALVGKSATEKVHSQGRVLTDRSVLYKYINPNLVAVLTEIEEPPNFKNVLNVYLIDTVSGSVVFSATHKRTLPPIQIVHSENWVVYSYYNDKTRRTEITALDLYEGKTQRNTTAFSSIWDPIVPIVERQSYILPASVDYMKETITEKGITSKHILVALDNGGVLELPWVFLDPRRPLASSLDMREEGAIPYTPELPVIPESIINYNQTLLRVKGIHTSPSGLESTCLVTVYGLDIFYTRVAPSKTFDMLKEDFDYLFITAVLLGLGVSAFMTKRLATNKALKQAWK